MNEHHFALLRELAKSIRFVTVGSAGLLLTYPQLRDAYVLPDSDFLLPREEVAAFAKWVEARGGVVTVWGEPWTDGADLTGKFYVRAHVDGLQLDATFEAPFDIPALIREARWIEGIPVCPERELWAAKVLKDEAAARRFAERYGLTIPESQGA